MTGPRGTPLDLRAVEARLDKWPPGRLSSADLVEEIRALLAHCRALRAALRLALDDLRALRGYEDDHSRAIAAVLAQGRDE